MTQGKRSVGPCAVQGCEDLAKTRGWCLLHYRRWWRTGQVEPGGIRVSRKDPSRSPCSVDGCETPFLAGGLCGRHYGAQHRNGSPTSLQYEWAPRTPCKVCGDDEVGRFRQFCSTSCRNAWVNHNGSVPLSKPCVSCGDVIEFLSRNGRGERRYRARSWCGGCNKRHRRYGATVQELCSRDGSDCALCHTPVDLALKRSQSLMCPSIDHIVPISRGGSFADPSNLQLAHLLCNIRKGARFEPSIVEVKP